MAEKKVKNKKVFSYNKIAERKQNKSFISEKLCNKKGSSLVLAIVVIALISIFSTLVLSLALNAYNVSVQNKWADEDFYYCEECLDDIYGIVVAETNDIFLKNYKTVLALFTQESPDIINRSFREGIKTDLANINTATTSDLYNALNQQKDAKDEEGNVIGELLVSYNDTRYKYDPSLLEEDFKKGRFVFEAVKVEYKNTSRSADAQNKYFASVTTDIVIYLPELVPSVETDTQGTLNYALVTGGEFIINGSVDIDGNLYVGGNLTVSEEADVKLFSNYVTICNQIKNNGYISITGSSATANIWCKDILIGGNQSSTILSGNIFVNEDIEVNGKNCSVQLSGKYYGYGDGTDDTKYFSNKDGIGTSMNSAILVNGEGTLLDMTGVTELVISGHSFFPVDSDRQYMGAESIATIVSQSIYMVDDKYIDFGTKQVFIGDENKKTMSFSDIKAKGKDLNYYLMSGYTLVTGGVEINRGNIIIDNKALTENEFAKNYIDDTEFVTLGLHETNGEKYCNLYWNFKSGDDIKLNGSDVIHEDYLTDLGGDKKIDIAGVSLKDVYVYVGGNPLTINKGNGESRVTVEDIFLQAYDETSYIIKDKYEYSYIFDDKYGEKLPSSINTSKFKDDYLKDDEPVVAVAILKSTSDAEYVYELYLQWNFDSQKVSPKNKGDVFISACINAGLVDGFLEKFMDGGYIKLDPNAKINTRTELYEYIIGSDGYAAKKYGSDKNSLFNSSIYSKNFANSYKWYMTTLIPEKYDPFGALQEFNGDGFASADQYSVFNRKSYYYTQSNAKIDSNYIDFSFIESNNVINYDIISSSSGVYKNLVVNGDLIVQNGVWTAGGKVMDAPFTKGIIFVDGDVLFDSDTTFEGLIIAKGKTEIKKGKFSSDISIIEGCLEALKQTDKWPLVSDEFYTRKTQIDTGTSSLNAIDCIKYENWTRNKESY